MSPLDASSPETKNFAYAPGDVVAGKYALEALLGTGGMGAVFRARNTVLDMPVAIKLIRADLDRELLSGRLLQEARAAARLQHPAIVRVFDVGKTALGDPFIVMELLAGETLGTLLEREGRINGARAVQLLLPIADALSVAHAKGFVHRDVKPDNVFIVNDEEGQLQPKLVDFGIVKEEQAGPDSQLTQLGSVMGSPDYMSPEQASGLDSIDLRSDVWSFCVVLYETITGHAPFQSKSYNALLRMIVETEPASLRELRAADGELSAIVSKGMHKQPGARWASMGQIGKVLASWLYDQGIGEDACGVSLESKWLSRSTDPATSGRATRSSAPDSWPEPPSGVRAVRRDFGTAPTVEVAKATPLDAPASSPAAARQRRLRWLVAGVATLLAAGLGWFTFAHRTASLPAAVTAPSPAAAAPPAAVTPSLTDATPPPVDVVAPIPNATATAGKPVHRPSPKQRALPHSKKSVIDLLPPY